VRQEVFEAYVEDVEEDEEWMSDASDEEDENASDEEDEDEEEEGEILDESDEELMEDEVEVESEEEEANQEPVTPWADPPTGLFDSSDVDAREWLQCSLAAVVTGLDAELGVVFEQLRSRGLDQTATWLLTSDFGYPLGEHGQIGRHRPWLHEELVHIPLIIRLPGAKDACRRVWMFTQPQDLYPTLIGLAELPSENASEGMNLVPVLHGEATNTRDHAITKLELGKAMELSIRTDEWSFLLPVKVPEGEKREPQLFSKPDDRWEVNDLHTHNIERCDEFEAQLRKQV
jgi:arylsulfatase A-like enzyme